MRARPGLAGLKPETDAASRRQVLLRGGSVLGVLGHGRKDGQVLEPSAFRALPIWSCQLARRGARPWMQRGAGAARILGVQSSAYLELSADKGGGQGRHRTFLVMDWGGGGGRGRCSG